jgi:ElaB/YqjD/DUF883 family membrane-anchored ribosome-binding protein
MGWAYVATRNAAVGGRPWYRSVSRWMAFLLQCKNHLILIINIGNVGYSKVVLKVVLYPNPHGAIMNTEANVSKDKIVQDFKTVYSDVEELLRATASQTGEKIGVIRERLQEHMHKAKDRLADTKEVVVDKTKQAARVTDEYVHDNPWHAVGIAAGVGLVIGLLIGRR